MIDIVLLVGRLLLVALLYLFLFVALKSGIGLVKGQSSERGAWTIEVTRGPAELKDLKLRVLAPVTIGRAPDADVVIASGYVSGHHARFVPKTGQLLVEDLHSTNGTMLNGHPLTAPTPVTRGDVVSIGGVSIKVGRD
ncbi:MAG: FHA domain-containing protein [Coriobacteriales bacterium]|nr:FHA domain-containing protein [Coriobacteriales bacterium]